MYYTGVRNPNWNLLHCAAADFRSRIICRSCNVLGVSAKPERTTCSVVVCVTAMSSSARNAASCRQTVNLIMRTLITDPN